MDEQQKFIFAIISLLLFFMLSYFVYHIFFVPMNWIKDLSDVGYEFATRNIKRKDSKREIINRIRKMRKIGDSKLIPPPFPNGWFALIESDKVKVGQAIDVACLGQHFVVFRTEKNEVNVLNAYCPHMGANLGIGGTVRGDCIECPFHQWSFRGSDGQCINIPYSTSGNIPKTAKLRKWISTEINDFIFIWHHAENEEPWKLSVIDEIQSKELVFLGRNEFTVNCHIQEIPENGADLAHFSVVHGDSILAGNVPKNRWTASIGTHIWDATWQASTELNTQHMAYVKLKHAIRFFKNLILFSLNVCGKQIGPSYVELHMKAFYGSIIVLQTVTPIEPMLQKVIHRFYSRRLNAPFVKLLALGESIMFERDVSVWNHKMFTNSPFLVKEDRTIKLYRNWYSQFYSQNSKTFVEAKETLEW